MTAAHEGRDGPRIFLAGDVMLARGIDGWEEYRPQLRLLYLATLDAHSHDLIGRDRGTVVEHDHDGFVARAA